MAKELKVIGLEPLSEMPFDRWDVATNKFIHATGWEAVLSDGTRINEYEDEHFNVGDSYFVYEEDEVIEESEVAYA